MYRFTTTWGIYFDIDMSRSEVSGHSRREARPSGCANMGELLRHRICPLARLLPIIYFELVIWVRIVTFQYGSRYGVGTALAYYLRPQTFWQEPCQVSGHSRREARPSGHLSPLAPDACPGTCVAPDALKPRKVPSVASERHCAPEHLARFLPSHLARFLPLQTPCRSLARFLPLPELEVESRKSKAAAGARIGWGSAGPGPRGFGICSRVRPLSSSFRD